MKRMLVKLPRFRLDPFAKRDPGLRWSYKTGILGLLCWTIFSMVTQGDNASLADAVEARNVTRTATLLSRRVDVNIPQVDGMTALHWAVHHDDGELGEKLLDLDANASAQNRYGITPLYLACVNGNANLVSALLTSGAGPNTTSRGGETVLMTAARTGDADSVTALIDAGAKIDAKERNGQTAAMWAAAEGHADVIRVLLAAGADYQSPLKRS